VEEEHQAIIFLYKSNRQRFENDILQKKDPFTKTLDNMCRVLAGWKTGISTIAFLIQMMELLLQQQMGQQAKIKERTRK